MSNKYQRELVRGAHAESKFGKIFSTTLFIFAALFLPSLIKSIFNTDSLTSGSIATVTVTAMIIIFGFYRFRLDRQFQIVLFGAMATSLFIIIHALIAYQFLPGSLPRTLTSVILFIFFIIGALIAKTILIQVDDATISKSLLAALGVFAITTVFGVLKIQPSFMSMLNKPMFPFAEPSHFAISLAPLVVYYVVNSPIWRKIACLIIVLMIGYYLENLSLIIVVGVAALCGLPWPLLIVGVAVFFIVFSRIETDYFTDRLDFSGQTTNISVLVYNQGIEMMEAGWRVTSGWGIGFQQLGIVSLNVPTSDLIFRLTRDDFNLRDGGFLAAKIFTELGYLGCIFIAGYLLLLFKAFIRLRRQIGRNPKDRNAPEIFILSIIVSFSMEMFVRGLGYFSGTVFLFLAAVLAAVNMRYLTNKY